MIERRILHLINKEEWIIRSFFYASKVANGKYKINLKVTLPVCVLRLDSVANPLPQILQWNGRFLSRSIWDSWFLRCCCRFDSWMKARPHSGMWHLYGRSPDIHTHIQCFIIVIDWMHFSREETLKCFFYIVWWWGNLRLLHLYAYYMLIWSIKRKMLGKYKTKPLKGFL